MNSSESKTAAHAKWLPAAQEKPQERFWYEPLIERGLIPDGLLRMAIRKMLRERLREEDRGSEAANRAAKYDFAEMMRNSPIALRADSANAQHYEVPADFFARVLGPRRKYSSALYEGECASPAEGLAAAEIAMLRTTCERAQLGDGQHVLELGCGWGSLTLWMAEQYPHSRITAVSNSASQREYILSSAAERGLRNVRVITADMNEFDPDIALAAEQHSNPAPDLHGTRFDRVVSVEMFEHMRNWEKLLQRIATWLKPDGKLFIHIFTHSRFAYPYEVRDSGDWMAQHFFTGGMMPSHDLLEFFADKAADGSHRRLERLRIAGQWRINGTHYAKTSEAWLANMDANKKELMPLFARTYGEDDANRWWHRWRIFFMACAELWNFGGGEEWIVSHYLLARSL